MADIRANCPSCGQVGMTAEAISLRTAHDGDRVHYGFTCPDCSTDVTRPADSQTVAILMAAGVDALGVEAERPIEDGALPEADRSPTPEAPAFTLDDAIHFHFLLHDDNWLAEQRWRQVL